MEALETNNQQLELYLEWNWKVQLIQQECDMNKLSGAQHFGQLCILDQF